MAAAKIRKANLVKIAGNLKIETGGAFAEIAARIIPDTSGYVITRSSIKTLNGNVLTLGDLEIICAAWNVPTEPVNPRIAPTRKASQEAAVPSYMIRLHLVADAPLATNNRIAPNRSASSEANVPSYMLRLHLTPDKHLAAVEADSLYGIITATPEPQDSANPRIAPTRNASQEITVPNYIHRHHRNERGCEMSARLLPHHIIMGTQAAFVSTDTATTPETTIIPEPAETETQEPAEETGTIFKIVDGCVRNVNHEPHKRGTNWLATVESDMKSPGGLSRDWWEKVSGNPEYYEMPDLSPGMYVEMAGDYRTAGGRKTECRSYFQIISVGGETISVTAIDKDDVGKYEPAETPEPDEDLRATIERLTAENASLRQELETLRAAQEIPPPAEPTTPTERYFAEKGRFEDDRDVLVYRMGDFYEILGPDAPELAPATELTLTQVNGTPMIGFPVRAAENYLPKITDAGRSYRLYPPPSGISLTDEDHAEIDEGAAEAGDIEMIEERFDVNLNPQVYKSCVKSIDTFTDDEIICEIARRDSINLAKLASDEQITEVMCERGIMPENADDLRDENIRLVNELENPDAEPARQAAPAKPKPKKTGGNGKSILSHITDIITEAGTITKDALCNELDKLRIEGKITSVKRTRKIMSDETWHLWSPKGKSYDKGIRKDGNSFVAI